MSFEFVTATHADEILRENLLASPCMKLYPCRTQRGFTNVAQAYNSIPKFSKYIVYVHHDVFLPESFMSQLKAAVMKIEAIDKSWAVLGVAGVRYENGRKINIGHVRDRGKEWGERLSQPEEIDTLDELLVITKGDFKFDENMPQDFYAADICMQAKLQGRKNYAIQAYCHHNSLRPFGGRTEGFYRSQEYFRNKWEKFLPIATTCSILT